MGTPPSHRDPAEDDTLVNPYPPGIFRDDQPASPYPEDPYEANQSIPDPYGPDPYAADPYGPDPYGPPDPGPEPDNDGGKRSDKAVMLGIVALLVLAGLLIGGLLYVTTKGTSHAVSHAYGPGQSQTADDPEPEASPPLDGQGDPATPSDTPTSAGPSDSPSPSVSPSDSPSSADTPNPTPTPTSKPGGANGSNGPSATTSPSQTRTVSAKLCRQNQAGPDSSLAYASPRNPGSTLFYFRNVNHGDEVQNAAFPHWARGIQTGSVPRTGTIQLQDTGGAWRPDTTILPQYGASEQAAYDDLINQAAGLWNELPQAGPCR